MIDVYVISKNIWSYFANNFWKLLELIFLLFLLLGAKGYTFWTGIGERYEEANFGHSETER